MPDIHNERSELVGRRICTLEGDHYATVLFYGKVGDTKGLWLGVEWDDSSRGKHQGVHDEVQYFIPSSSSTTSSSFIRLNKVSLGVDIVTGVKERYGKVDGGTGGVEQHTINNFRNTIGARFVEVVGFDKVNLAQCQLDKLSHISICDMKINDEFVDLFTHLPSIRDLDLSKNLLTSWNKIGKLLSKIPIKVLNVSENRIPVPEQFPIESLSSLHHLIIGDMGYSWQDIEQVAGYLPSLQVLQAHNNKLRSVSVRPGCFAALQDLDLDNNQFTDWTSLNSLHTINTLISLRLNYNKLKSVDIEDDQFKNLTSLQLSHNLLDEWKQVGKLNKLKLKELRLRYNPVLDREGESTARSMIIAVVGSISILNGTEITKEERNWSELDYYKKYGLEYLGIKKLPDSQQSDALKVFKENHLRYLDIVNKFGEPEEGELVVKENNIKSSLVSVKLRCPDVPGTADTAKKLPASMTVAKLKALVGRLYKKISGGNEIRMYVQSGKDAEQKVELDNDLRELSFYSLQEGDIILVRWLLDTQL